MAVIKSAKAIECLIPKPNKLAFMSMITHTPEKALHLMTVYGVKVDMNTDKVEKIYQIAFSLFASPSSYYLFIRGVESELTTGTPFIKAKTENGETAERIKRLKVKESIVKHSKLDKLFGLTTKLLDELCKASLGPTKEEREAEKIIGEIHSRSYVNRENTKRFDDQRKTKIQKGIKMFRAISITEKRENDLNNDVLKDNTLL